MTHEVRKVKRVEVLGAKERPLPEVGSWWWVKLSDDDYNRKQYGERWLACVVRVGTNYAKLRGVGLYELEQRVHFDEWDEVCEHEPDALSYIDAQVRAQRELVGNLMGEVHELTARLAIPVGPALTAGNDAQALAVRGASQPVGEYKAALVKAKDKTLPALFEQINVANKLMAKWMTAGLEPLKAEARGLEKTVKAVEQRIFHVELYAGLTEEAVEVLGGEPASLETPVHLMQRRCYMDEECLARYEVGGMEFADVEAFDRWLARPENLERLLPHPRCITAFQVRRGRKERDGGQSLMAWIHIMNLEKLDKLTFIYVRNGERLYRIGTAIEFGERLFPDLDHDALASGEPLYAKRSFSKVEQLVTEGAFLQMKAEETARRKAHKAKVAAWKLLSKARRKRESEPWYSEGFRAGDWHRFDRESVYYDDIAAHVAEQMARHNRLVIVLQGLLDRSPTLHPHPPWQLWTQEGFSQALRLVRDDSRALVAGERPDFEAYRARLNSTLVVGSVTIGQEGWWLRREAERYNRRNRHSDDHRYTTYHPYGDPGPGAFARIAAWKKGAFRVAMFRWSRKRQTADRWSGKWYDDPLPTSVAVPATALFNVDAYQPGDFRAFFEDPRTRAEYLKWAPLLLEAEEYKAGNRKLGGNES